MCLLRLHAAQQPDSTILWRADPISCSHGCLPKSVQARGGEIQAQTVLEHIFKTSLTVEEYYWCDRGGEFMDDMNSRGWGPLKEIQVGWTSRQAQCKLARPDEITKRHASCSGDDCLYTGPAPVRMWHVDWRYGGARYDVGNMELKPKAGLCDKDVEKGQHWGCTFRTCTTDGCNFSAAPNSATHAFSVIILSVFSLVLTVAHKA